MADFLRSEFPLALKSHCYHDCAYQLSFTQYKSTSTQSLEETYIWDSDAMTQDERQPANVRTTQIGSMRPIRHIKIQNICKYQEQIKI